MLLAPSDCRWQLHHRGSTSQPVRRRNPTYFQFGSLLISDKIQKRVVSTYIQRIPSEKSSAHNRLPFRGVVGILEFINRPQPKHTDRPGGSLHFLGNLIEGQTPQISQKNDFTVVGTELG